MRHEAELTRGAARAWQRLSPLLRPLTGRRARRGPWRTGPQWHDYVVPYGAMLLGMAMGALIAIYGG